jgi:hypothetical protein
VVDLTIGLVVRRVACCELNSIEAVAKPWAGAGAVSECDSSCGLVFCPVRLLEMPPEQGFYG